MSHKVIVIGGGAAGYFAAIHCAQANKNAEVILFEKSSKVLQKVKVSGGGRCNVTHSCFDLKQLSLSYPRGEKQLKSAFARFSPKDTIEWFESRKVKLKTEKDGRMFPVSDDSQSIIDCLEKEIKKSKVSIRLETSVKKIIPNFHGGFELVLDSGEKVVCSKIIVASGGSPKEEGLHWLKELGHRIETPVPSLFTFNIPNNPIIELQGIAVPSARVRILNTKLECNGPVLITHWGLSGPAILRTSSLGARILADKDYEFEVQLSWLDNKKEDSVRQELFNLKAANPAKKVGNLFPFTLPKRLNSFLLAKAGVDEDANWGDVSKEMVNQVIQCLLYDTYLVKGKTTFKEEFVTCGGVNLDDVDFKNMESKRMRGLFFAGEVLDIDGITGGFNFQAAWTTGFIAGKAAAVEL
ncbi:MAG: aminoacetone oxidase family FAD-binding enzyme [Bacteroidetes bacterium B1(2017)]|nr:MAG: aminoacetone oxidase family FAD-binding enzyme [Bacteroidetes bacterium B1(2017)]